MTKITKLEQNHNFKAGQYVISDPCYVTPDELWMDFCDLLSDSRDDSFFEFEGLKYWVGSTAYGDGCYNLYQKGVRCGQLAVDAGLLAIIPVELVKQWGSYDKAIKYQKRNLLCIVDIEKDFTVSYCNGNFDFANFTVITDVEEEEEDYYE